MGLQSQRDERYHRRSCVNESIHLLSTTGRKTKSVIRTLDQNHCSPDRRDINHLTHSSGIPTFTPDFDIRAPIKTPRASDSNAWNTISDHFAMLHSTNPIYKHSDPPSTKLNKLNTFTYSFFEHEYGIKEQAEKKPKRQRKD